MQRHDEAAIAEVISKCEKWVDNIAGAVYRKVHRNLSRSIEYDDLKSEGLIGLYQATRRYDNSRQNKFYTFAQRRIRGQILDFIRKRSIIPKSIQTKIKMEKEARKALEATLGREPEDQEVAERMGITWDEYQDIKTARKAGRIISLEEIRQASEDESGNTSFEIACEEPFEEKLLDNLERMQKIEIMDRFIRSYPDRTREILYFYCCNYTQEDIGIMHGITGAMVNRILSQCKKEIKCHLETADKLRMIDDQGIFKPPGSLIPNLTGDGIINGEEAKVNKTKSRKRTNSLKVTSIVRIEMQDEQKLTLETLLKGAGAGIRMVDQELHSISVISEPSQTPVPIASLEVNKQKNSPARKDVTKINAKQTMSKIKKKSKSRKTRSKLDAQGAAIVEDLISSKGKYGTLTRMAEKYDVHIMSLRNWIKTRVVYNKGEKE